MKKTIYAIFPNVDSADQAINQLHQQLRIDKDDISYVYRNVDGEKVAGDATTVADDTVTEGAASGATTGGVIGAALGLVASLGVLGPIGAVVSAGPILTALGITGAAGTVVAGGVVGAAAGGLIGALTNLGISEPRAREYEEAISAGAVLVSVATGDDASEATAIINDFEAHHIEIIEDNL